MAVRASKPLDLGTGRVIVSFDPRSAGWLSIGTPHPRHGFVELNAIPPFDEAARGDPAATRRHRLAMTRAAHALLIVEVDGEAPALEPDCGDPARIGWSSPPISVVATAPPGTGAVRQQWTVRSLAGHRPTITLRLRGHLDRPALAEITETDPPPPTGASTTFEIRGATVRVAARALPAELLVRVVGAAVHWQPGCEGTRGSVAWPSGPEQLTFEIVAGLDARPAPPATAASSEDDRLVGRALAYVRGCTALQVATGERVMLTDHRILPLSWTRDAYWQALALLVADAPGDREIVADHLRWLWRRCERPDGRWVRSHHASGRRKDLAFQADQQLYPIVELADFWRLDGALPDGVDWAAEISRAWLAAVAEIDPGSGLIASAENAADDPVAAPFIAASQILLWCAAGRLAELAPAAGLDRAPFARAADAAHAAFEAAFARGGAWPYAVGPGGQRVTYHDANDLPTALAPLWGFCTRDDPGWRATMSFAFSRANPAWVDGARPGLGSLHTPGPWTLGDLQAWIRAVVLADEPAAGAAVRRLETVAFADGMLPEAYGADYERRVRHWFAWPGAAFAALRSLQRARRIDRLRVQIGSVA
ncbi:MAG: glycoside hydrolase family 125 protein [Chloroflexota bacterium]